MALILLRKLETFRNFKNYQKKKKKKKINKNLSGMFYVNRILTILWLSVLAISSGFLLLHQPSSLQWLFMLSLSTPRFHPSHGDLRILLKMPLNHVVSYILFLATQIKLVVTKVLTISPSTIIFSVSYFI